MNHCLCLLSLNLGLIGLFTEFRPRRVVGQHYPLDASRQPIVFVQNDRPNPFAPCYWCVDSGATGRQARHRQEYPDG